MGPVANPPDIPGVPQHGFNGVARAVMLDMWVIHPLLVEIEILRPVR